MILECNNYIAASGCMVAFTLAPTPTKVGVVMGMVQLQLICVIVQKVFWAVPECRHGRLLYTDKNNVPLHLSGCIYNNTDTG